MTGETEQKLQDIFKIVLDLPSGDDPTRLRRLTEPRWDSLAHTSLIAAIESEFGVKLDLADIERVSSFEAARLILEESGL